jgi:hypothetical protein
MIDDIETAFHEDEGREPLKRARTTAMAPRRPASFLTCWKAAATIGLASLKEEETLVILSRTLWNATGSSVLRKKPRRERSVIMMGKTCAGYLAHPFAKWMGLLLIASILLELWLNK